MEIFWGMFRLSGTMLNDTGKDYIPALFNIRIFDKGGKLLTTGLFAINNFPYSQEGSIAAVMPIDIDINLYELNYEITFDSGQ